MLLKAMRKKLIDKFMLKKITTLYYQIYVKSILNFSLLRAMKNAILLNKLKIENSNLNYHYISKMYITICSVTIFTVDFL